MSINFDDPTNEKTRELIREAFGDTVAAADEKTFLIDRMKVIDSRVMKSIANAAKQPAKVELHEQGEIKTLADGTRYEATADGWCKITNVSGDVERHIPSVKGGA